MSAAQPPGDPQPPWNPQQGEARPGGQEPAPSSPDSVPASQQFSQPRGAAPAPPHGQQSPGHPQNGQQYGHPQASHSPGYAQNPSQQPGYPQGPQQPAYPQGAPSGYPQQAAPGAPPQGYAPQAQDPRYGPQGPSGAPQRPRQPSPGLGMANLGLYGGAFLLFCLTIAKLLAVFDPHLDRWMIVTMSVIGLLSILLIAAVIIFGHIGLARSSKTGRGRARSAIALTTGYILALLWLLRLVAALFAVMTYSDDFMMTFYYWA